jgi:hypothetical protein
MRSSVNIPLPISMHPIREASDRQRSQVKRRLRMKVRRSDRVARGDTSPYFK